MTIQVTQVYTPYQDLDGQPLENGYVYIGEVDENPETSPLAIYYDLAATQPAAQPLRTLNGFIMRAGTPTNIFVNELNYSITVRNQQGELVMTSPASVVGGGSPTVTNLTVINNIEVGNDGDVEGDLHVGGNLDVDGNSNFDGDVQIDGDLNVDGNINGGTMSINGVQIYSGVPQNSQNAGYTLVLSDAGKHIYAATAGAFTIPANASVAFPIGTIISFVNLTTTCTIPITSDTMYLAGDGSTGTRTLLPFGVATILKVTPTAWVISGMGVA